MYIKLILILTSVRVSLQEPKETSNIINVIRDTDYKEKLNESQQKLVVIGFHNSSCTQRVLEFVQDHRENRRVVFILVDKHQCTGTAKFFNISTVPAFVFQKNNFKFDSFVGTYKPDLRGRIEKYQNRDPPKNVIRVTDDTDFKKNFNDIQNRLVVIAIDSSLREQNAFIVMQASEYLDVMFLLVNRDDCTRSAKFFNNISVPEFVIQKNRFEFERFEGADNCKLMSGIERYRTQEPPHNVIRVMDDRDFHEKLTDAQSKLVVIGFDGNWCKQNTSFQKQAEEYIDVVFFLVDKDLCDDIAKTYAITTPPAFVFQKRNFMFERYAGADETKLKECIDRYRSQDPLANLNRVKNDTDFKEKLKEAQNKLVVIGFDGSWCDQKDSFLKQALEYEDVVFLLVDKDACKSTAESYKMYSPSPEFVFQKSNFTFERFSYADDLRLKECIDRYRTQDPPTNLIRATTDTDFRERLKEAENKLVVIGFDGSWCDQKATFQKPAEEYKDVMFLLVDRDTCTSIAESFKIYTAPAFAFHKSNFTFESFSRVNNSRLKECIDLYRTQDPPVNLNRVINNTDFKEKLKEAQDKLVVIGFDGSCCDQKSTFLKQALVYKDVVFLLVDSDACKSTAGSYNIYSPPAFVFQKSNFTFESFSRADPIRLKGCIDRYRTQVPPTNIIRVIDVNDFNTNLRAAQNKLIVISFDDSSCDQNTPVKKLAVVYEDVVFLLVDKDECGRIAQSFEIDIVPAIVLQKNCNTLASGGTVSQEWLEFYINKHLK